MLKEETKKQAVAEGPAGLDPGDVARAVGDAKPVRG
jgi:hypothetical protein